MHALAARRPKHLCELCAGLLLCFTSFRIAVAQDRPEPETGFRVPAIAFQDIKIVQQPGQVIENGNLILRDGFIEAVGPDAAIPPDARVINGAGLIAYPGFIDAATSSLIDPEALKPKDDPPPDFRQNILAGSPTQHRRGMTPEFLAHEHLVRAKGKLEAYRKAGFTSAHVAPLRGIAGGQGCMLALGDGPLDDVLLNPHSSAIFKLQPLPKSGSNTNQYPMTTMGAIAYLRQAWFDVDWGVGRRERQGKPRSLVLEALGIQQFEDFPVGFIADSPDEIDRALVFPFAAASFPRRCIIGARDAARRIDRLKASTTAPVVLRVDHGNKPQVEPQRTRGTLTAEFTPPMRVQEAAVDRWREQMTTAAKLDSAGISYLFTSMGCTGPDDFLKRLRGLVAAGVPADLVLAGIVQTATDFAITDRSLLEQDYRAHVTVMNGPWENTETKVRYVVIGEELFEYNRDAEPSKPTEPSAGPPPEIAGTWTVSIAAGDMQTTPATLTLTQDGETLRGAFDSESGDGKVFSGRATVEKIEFAVAIGAGQRDVTLTFEGKHNSEDDTLAGTMKSPFGPPTEWTATRVNEQQPPANPVEITLEEDDANPKASAAELPSELESDRLAAAGPPEDDLLLTNGTILTGAGQTLVDHDLRIRDGKIAEIGPDLAAEEGVTAIDATGWFLTPGIIDTHSHIMISGGVNESSNSVVPEVRIKDVVRSDDPREYRALAGGVTTARLLHGSSNTIGGQDAVVKLRHGEPAAAHIIGDAPQGVKFALGENPKRRGDRFPNTRMGVEATLKRSFSEALAYRREWQKYEQAERADRRQPSDPNATVLPKPRRDLRLEELVDIIEGRSFIHCHCYRADEILMLLSTADELGIQVRSLQHVLEGYKIAPEIAAHGVSCSTFSDWWAFKIEAYDATPYNTTALWKAGVNVVVKSDDPEVMRHLPLEAAKSLRYGNMPEHAALQMVTLNAARELGLDDRIGSLEVGKDGDVAVFNGHPFNPFARCELTIIDGRVCFQRSRQPTAMSLDSQERSVGPHPLELAPADVRERTLELPTNDDNLYAVRGAMVHPVDAPDIQGTVIIENGRIASVGPDAEVPDGAAVIDASGLHVYPGLIDAGTTLGITEISLVDATHDYADSGRIQPDLRASTAINVDSELIPVSRAGGITTALVRPEGALIAGQCALLQPAGWTAPDMVLNGMAGLSLEWPGDDADQSRLREFFAAARVYERIMSQPEESRPDVVSDPRYDAMLPYLRGERPVFVEAHNRKSIAQALLFAEQQQFNLVLTGATDAWKLADEIKARDVPVILGPTMRGPIEDWNPFDAPYTNAARLFEAGVLFCVRSNSASNSRNAPFQAAICVAYGLPEDEALEAVTLSAARVLGIDHELGSITPGKRANLIITDGSPLQPTTQIKAVFVAGRPFAPESKQTRLYERYLQRLRER